MHKQNKIRIPPQYIVLDALGSILVWLGIYGLIVDEAPPALASLNLKQDAWEFVIGGLILMVPMIVHIIRRARTGNLERDQ
jgi:hypothetical protein